MGSVKKRIREPLGKILLGSGAVKEEQLRHALEEQARSAGRIGEVLLRLGLVDEETVLKALAQQLHLPFFCPGELTPDPAAAEAVPVRMAYRYKLAPLHRENRTLTVAMSNPFDLETRDELRQISGCEVKAVVAPEQEILRAIRLVYGIGADTMDRMVEAMGPAPAARPAPAVGQAPAPDDEEAAIVQLVNQIIQDGHAERATDIHLEPFQDRMRIRYRVDGVLREATSPPGLSRFQSSLVTRLKIMAELNIAERRLPQDGRIRVEIKGELCDIRLSVVPTLHGETVNLRILPAENLTLGLDALGMPDGIRTGLEHLLDTPQGLVLTTGPTGHGKTTTLYACLGRLNRVERKVFTIEDPVEYRLDGVNQMAVHPKIGLTFAEGLRALLRQDPDILMVGEIRDRETAEVAIRASLTGHLVLSTLHTNDAASAVARLVDMGVEPYLVASSLRAVVAQRLVRVVCPACAGAGCPGCGRSGYRGRTGLYELLTVSETIQGLITGRASAGVIRDEARKGGMRTLLDDGRDKVKAGLTTLAEVLRVVGEAVEG